MSDSGQRKKPQKSGLPGFLKAPVKVARKILSRSRSPQPASRHDSSQSVEEARPLPDRSASKHVGPPQDDAYLAAGGLPSSSNAPVTTDGKIKATADTAYEGVKAVLEALYDCSDMFLPLKAASGALLNIMKTVDRVYGNRDELKALQNRLNGILSIVSKYQDYGIIRALEARVEIFCSAIDRQIKTVQGLLDKPRLSRIAESKKDAEAILKTFREISNLCDIFQIDTQLNTEKTASDILERLKSNSIEKLNHEMISYKTRQSSYGEATGCLAGTRVKILQDLEAWALATDGPKVYWMVGMAGTGKSTITHTLCEILDGKNTLGTSFFGSRASDKTSNPRLIIHAIAYALAKASPPIRSEIIRAIEHDSTLAEATFLNLKEQFNKLIRTPIQNTADDEIRICKVVVIDALDEFRDLRVVSAFIQLVLQLPSNFPLKFFFSSRDEILIRRAFDNNPPALFTLHEVEKDIVQSDIRRYIETSLLEIKNLDPKTAHDEWPTQQQLLDLVRDAGHLFIYAATAIRYIKDGHLNFQSRLLSMLAQHNSSKLHTSGIDKLYSFVLEHVCEQTEPSEIKAMQELLSIIIFVQIPLSLPAIVSLWKDDASIYLPLFSSVLHVPTQLGAPVVPFHASFPDFIIDPERCLPSTFPALKSQVCHSFLALKCLQHMNQGLKYNICDVDTELTISHRDIINSPESADKIGEALKYSCLYWAFHLQEIQTPSQELLECLRKFLFEHLLHWIECLSTLHELQTGIESLLNARKALAGPKMQDLQSILYDGVQFLRMNFECIQKNSFQTYWSALVWIPKTSWIYQNISSHNRKIPQIIVGQSDSWGPSEIVIRNHDLVDSVAFSPDGAQVVSGSEDNTVRIWNAMTGEVKAELRGHTHWVTSVAFSPDGAQVVSGSKDNTVRIWNAMTGEVKAELRGHTGWVLSVAFSPDGAQVVSGSEDATVRIWNAMTGEVKAELTGHRISVRSVAFSPDGAQVVSGSWDSTVRIWNAMTGEVKAELTGHTHFVTSVAFSPDGAQVVSGSEDETVKIWNAMTGEVKAELRGHTHWVTSVAFSPDGAQMVSGSKDNTVRIWNAMTGEVKAELRGHTGWVASVAFSPDGAQVVSGSDDQTVRIWNAMTGEVKAESTGHTDWVSSVAFSPNGAQVVSGSGDKTVRIWNAMTGEVKAELRGHTGWVLSVAFSPDGAQVVSGSEDETVKIWNAITGEVKAELRGHTDWVSSVAFSPDGAQVVSGSKDNTVRIWNAMTGEVKAELTGHTNSVASVAFSQDGAQVVSGSDDHTVRIWNAMTGEVRAELTGHTYPVASVAFSPDGALVVSGSYDKTVRISNWRTGHTDRMIVESRRLGYLTSRV